MPVPLLCRPLLSYVFRPSTTRGDLSSSKAAGIGRVDVVTLSMAVGRFDIFATFVIIGRVDVFASFTVIGWVDFFAGFIVVRLVCVSSLFCIIGDVNVFPTIFFFVVRAARLRSIHRQRV
jgi:hypothetical protein